MARRINPKAGAPALPSREQILAFITETPGKVGKREIAKAFGISGADKIVDELRAEAAKNARRKAEMLAAALDVKVGRVLDVRTGDAPVEMARPRMMAMKAAGAAPPVEAGTQTLGADVTVSFEIAP